MHTLLEKKIEEFKENFVIARKSPTLKIEEFLSQAFQDIIAERDKEIVEYVKRQVILSPQHEDWGANLSKAECFNDGVNEVIYRLDKLTHHKSATV